MGPGPGPLHFARAKTGALDDIAVEALLRGALSPGAERRGYRRALRWPLAAPQGSTLLSRQGRGQLSHQGDVVAVAVPAP
ncbi:hypothetical protein GCM10010104_26900 [Streptomyces indiaensis]|uniref:Uncharacterized protein n=1 Tax=Streptomyces indiaensis TaxID=284033 RepID=A0ABN3DII5_9ACTN